MDPITNYEQNLLLASSLIMANLARCLDKAGLLDDQAYQSIEGHLATLAEDAEAVPSGEAILGHFDLLVKLLPRRPD